MLIEAGDHDDDDEEAFLEAEEEDEEDEDGALILEGPDFDVLDDAFQGGLGGEPHEPAAVRHHPISQPIQKDSNPT